MRSAWTACLLVFPLLSIGACSGNRAGQPQSTQPESSAQPQPAPVDAVEATIVFTDCPSVSRAHNRAAQRTVDRLVEDCTKVPGGEARFHAVLEPGGNIDIQTPRGDAEGVVPMCVLKHQLRHNLWLKKPCRMDVKLEERDARAEQ